MRNEKLEDRLEELIDEYDCFDTVDIDYGSGHREDGQYYEGFGVSFIDDGFTAPEVMDFLEDALENDSDFEDLEFSFSYGTGHADDDVNNDLEEEDEVNDWSHVLVLYKEK